MPSNVIQLNVVLFQGADTNGASQLWETDGTTAGTKILGPFNGAASDATGLQPIGLTALGTQVLFAGRDASGNSGLWVTNGGPSDTHELTGISNVQQDAPGLNPYDLVAFGQSVLFGGYDAGNGNDVGPTQRLWVTDGTAAGTHVVTTSLSFPQGIAVFGDKILLNAQGSDNEFDLFVSDGTDGGTQELTGITGASVNFNPGGFTVFGNEVLFAAFNTVNQFGLWVTDGTAQGTQEIAVSGAYAGGVIPENMTVFGNVVLFDGHSGLLAKTGLWVTDGSSQGTHEITGIAHVSSGGLFNNGIIPGPNFTVFGNEVLFEGVNDQDKAGLWVTDGTALGTHEITGINGASTSGLAPSNLVVFGDMVLFSGVNASGNSTLWATDGTAQGTHEIANIADAKTPGFFPTDLTLLPSTVAGGAGSDTFAFNTVSLALAQAGHGVPDTITDYDQGDTGSFSLAEGDRVDVSAIVGTAYNQGAGEPVNALVRVVESAAGNGALLQVDSDGSANGHHWDTLAKLDHLHQGQTVSAMLDGTSFATNDVAIFTDAGALGDFNGDGTFDALWRNDDGSTAIWQMSNGGVGTVVFPTGVPNAWHIVGVGDFNGDNTSDVLWRNDDGTVLEWQMNNNTVQSSPVVGVQDASTWTVAGIGDFDHDTKSDILWKVDDGNGSYDVVVWQMNGATVSSSATAGTLNNAWGIVGTGDFDGDGKTDILFRNADDATTAIWNMNGATHANSGFEPGVPTDWHVVGTGDFNGDHTTDILWQNDGGVIAIWQMTNDQPTATGFFGVGTNWHVVGIGDMNHDGNADILWRGDDGSTAVSLMNGTTVQSTSFPGGVPADWEPTTHHYDFV